MISNSSFSTPVARGGAAFRGVGCPWASVMPGAGQSYVPAQVQIPGLAVVTPASAKLRVVADQTPALARPLAVPAELPLINNRKQYVHMTRVVAGGEGALGPYPEREPV